MEARYVRCLLFSFFVCTLLSLGVRAQEIRVNEAVAYDKTPLSLLGLTEQAAGVHGTGYKTRPRVRFPIPRQSPGRDPVLQDWMGTIPAEDFNEPKDREVVPNSLVNFEGLSNLNNENNGVIQDTILVPDMNIAVGENHVIQMVNMLFSIYDKSGNQVTTPRAITHLWQNFEGPACDEYNHGDPIVLYDEYADRWLLSQMVNVDSDDDGVVDTGYQCIAVSETSDPTGYYWRYAFELDGVNDYPKLGVAHDSYLFTYMEQTPPAGVVVAGAFDRASMLNGGDGKAPKVLVGRFPFEQYHYYGMLPADFDGPLPDSQFDRPRIFAGITLDQSGEGNNEIPIYRLDVDWSDPEQASFNEVDVLLPAWFDPQVCQGSSPVCIPQPDTDQELDTVSDALMQPLHIRDMGDYLAMVVNHTVDVSGAAGIRWYEFQSSDYGSTWRINQEGTYSPDADHRWVGSIAINSEGKIGLIYTVSGNWTHPSIRYIGRRPLDLLGIMSIEETVIHEGSASQQGCPPSISCYRWGDYAALVVDPTDGTTFWGTHEYATSSQTIGPNWATRIFSFQIPDDDPPDPPDPPDSLQVSIEGPDEMEPNSVETWESVISGGTPSYSRQWTYEFCDHEPTPDGVCLGHRPRDGGTASHFQHEADKKERWLIIFIEVTDSEEQTAQAIKYVTIAWPPPSVSIYGPDWRWAGEKGTWTANVSGGGPGETSYSWRFRYTYCHWSICNPDHWYDIAETSPILAIAFDEPSSTAQIQVLVQRGTQTVRRSKSINVLDPDNCPPCLIPADSNEVAKGLTDADIGMESTLAPSLVVDEVVPDAITLEGSKPNPFTADSEIVFGLPRESDVRLTVYDLLGREVAQLLNGSLPAGWHSVRLDGSPLAAGIHLIRLESEGTVRTVRITHVK